MPQPSNSNAVLRPELGIVAHEYSMSAVNRGFVGLSILPLFRTAKQAGTYPVITAKSLLSLPETARAPRTGYNRDDYTYDSGHYVCSENGFEQPIDDSERQMLASYFDAEALATQRAYQIIERKQEKRIADLLFNEVTFTPHAPSAAWNVFDTAEPKLDVDAGKRAVEDVTGLTPNTLIVTRQAVRDLSMCAAVIDRIKYTNPAVSSGELSPALLAAYFNVDRLVVAGGVYDSANPGQGFSPTGIWNKSYAMLCVCSSGSIDLREPSIGRTMLWTEDSPENVVVESYRDESIRSDVIRARQNTQEALQMVDAGYLLKGVWA